MFNLLKLGNIVDKFTTCILLNLKLTLVVKNSYTTWWKNFLCLEGAFKILVNVFLLFVKKKLI